MVTMKNCLHVHCGNSCVFNEPFNRRGFAMLVSWIVFLLACGQREEITSDLVKLDTSQGTHTAERLAVLQLFLDGMEINHWYIDPFIHRDG